MPASEKQIQFFDHGWPSHEAWERMKNKLAGWTGLVDTHLNRYYKRSFPGLAALYAQRPRAAAATWLGAWRCTQLRRTR